MSKNYLLLFLLKKHYLESLKALKFKIGKRRRRKTNKKQLLNDELDSLTVTRKSVTELAENFFCSTVFSLIPSSFSKQAKMTFKHRVENATLLDRKEQAVELTTGLKNF